ncbi:MAG: glutaredoxin domain-containing protein, partial [Negativibacillus sp.]
MRKVILYGTPTCGDCPPVKEALTQAGVKFAFVDVCESVGSLKKFLKL